MTPELLLNPDARRFSSFCTLYTAEKSNNDIAKSRHKWIGLMYTLNNKISRGRGVGSYHVEVAVTAY